MREWGDSPKPPLHTHNNLCLYAKRPFQWKCTEITFVTSLSVLRWSSDTRRNTCEAVYNLPQKALPVDRAWWCGPAGDPS